MTISKFKISNKVLSVLLCLALLLSYVPLSSLTAFAADLQTNADGTYLLYTSDDLKAFADHVNSGNYDADAILMDSIIYEGTASIGTADIALRDWDDGYTVSNIKGYSGVFDGNGYTVTMPVDTYLFGAIDGATVKNLTVSGGNKAIVAYVASGSVLACNNTSTISGWAYCGGIVDIVGAASSASTSDAVCVIRGCANYGNLNVAWNVGGIAGAARGKNVSIDNCANYGNFDLRTGRYVGGIVGKLTDGATVSYCFDSSTRSNVLDGNYAIAYPSNSTVSNSFYVNGGAQTGATQVSGLTEDVLNTLNQNTSGITWKISSITGTVNIGSPHFGDRTLHAIYTGNEIVAYQWYLDGEAISGATSTTYLPSYADIGKTIKVVVSGIGNYSGSVETEYVFKPFLQDAVMETSSSSFVYNGQSQRPTVTLTYAGVTLREGVDYEVYSYLADDDGVQKWEGGIPVKFFGAPVDSINADSYYVFAKGIGDFTSANAAIFTIKKADQNAPAVQSTNETISGKKDGAITTVNSTMEYRKDGETEYTAISGETVTDLAAGKYYVRVKGDSNHNPSPDTAITVGEGRKLQIVVPQNQEGYTVTVNKTEMEYEGSYTLKVEIHEGYTATEDFKIIISNWECGQQPGVEETYMNAMADQIIEVHGVADTTAPEAEISITTNKWTEFLKDITFGLFFKETQDITITAIDKGSGEDKIYYYISEDVLTEDEVKALTADKWTLYDADSKPSINPDKQCVVYAKATDKAQNVKYISSTRLVFDGTAPKLYGIENGGIYYGDQIFKATDDNFLKIEVDGIDITATTQGDDEYKIVADNAEHTILVTDKAGNITEWKITVYKQYTVTFKADGVTVDTQTVGHGKDATAPTIPTKDGYTQTAPTWDKDGKNITTDTEINAVYTINKYTVTYKADGEVVDTVTVEHGENATLPAVPAKDGYVGKWDNNGKNITSDTTVSAVYTEIPVVKPDEVEPDDKTELEDTKKQLEDMLNGDSYTEDDKKDIQEAIDGIDDALEVIGNVEAVEELIGKLPENITKSDEDAIKAADDAYNALSDYEKSLVDKDAKKALDDAKAAFAELNKPADTTSPNTGDNSNLWLWVALLFISGGATITLTVYDRKRRMANK